MATAVDIVVRILTKLDDAGLNQAQGKFGKFSSGVSKASKVATVGLVALGGAAVLAANAAAQDEQAQAILANTLTKSAGASKTAIAATEDWISAQSKATGVADDELRPALGALVRATGDVETSQKALQVAMDVSAATGKPLQSVSEAMAKGFGGTTTSLGKLVPGMDKAVLASGNMGKIMDELKSKTGGAAKAAGDTAAGKMKKFQTQMGEVQEGLGAGLLPVMENLSDILLKVTDYAQKNTKAFQIIIAVVAAFAAAIVVLNVAIKVARTLQIAWNIAMSLNPIGLIVIAIIALIAGLVLAYKKSETFRRIVDAAFKGVLNAAKVTWKWIKTAFTTLWKVLQYPVKAYWAYIKFVFNAIRTIITVAFKVIKTVVTGAWGAIKSATNTVRETTARVWAAIKSTVTNVAKSIKTVVTGAWDAIADKVDAIKTRIVNTFTTMVSTIKGLFSQISGAITSALQGAVNAINKLIRGANKLPGVNIPEVSIYAATAARGSLVPSGMVGTPRVRGRASAGPSSAAVAPVVINVNGAMDPDAVARQIKRLLGAHDRRVGLAR